MKKLLTLIDLLLFGYSAENEKLKLTVARLDEIIKGNNYVGTVGQPSGKSVPAAAFFKTISYARNLHQ